MKDIKFSNTKVQKIFQDAKILTKKVGLSLAKQIIKRLDQLSAFANVYELINAPIDNPHLLEGNLVGCIGWSVDSKHRLILDTGLSSNPTDLKQLNNIEEIIIKGVVDYHGNKDEWIIN